jgi:hypothetical protein
MNANDVYPTNYLKAEDIHGSMTVTVARVALEKMHDKTGKEIEKPVVGFLELPKSLVTNKTNWKTLTKLFGEDTDAWISNRITMVVIPVDAFGETVDGIRLIPVKPTVQKKTEAQLIAELEEPEAPEPPVIDAPIEK